MISEWAIRSSDCRVFEPSFGGCGFLRSAHDRLISLEAKAPAKQIFGCDIDPEAFYHLATLFEGPVDLQRFREGDFLDQDFPASWVESFDAVIGNPPYLPYRKIDPTKRDEALSVLRFSGLKLDRRASLWAYFVALAVRFVAVGGRMAWVLPSSFLHANYSRELRKYISSTFSDVRAFELHERQFLLEGTEEKTIVLLADGKLEGRSPSTDRDIDLVRCPGVRDLSTEIRRWSKGGSVATSGCGTSVFDSLSKAPKDLFMQLKSSECYTRLGDHMRIQIGLVTGNNGFFLQSEADWLGVGISSRDLMQILPRFQYAQGLELCHGDAEELAAKGARSYLLSVSDIDQVPNEIRDYLKTYPIEELLRCSTFKKRSLWTQTADGAVPDAFFPVMQHNGPRLVLNVARLNCTNSVHRGYFNLEVSETSRKLIALVTLSTFSQISAEINGRSYGSGALKHEPREAEGVGILLPHIHHLKVNSVYRKADLLLRGGNFDEASQIVDLLILNAMGLDSIPARASVLRSGLAQLRKNRQR